jgi:hypothetical protein
MTPLIAALCVLLGGPELSPEAREGQRVLDGLCWPAGMTFKIADPVTPPSAAPIALPKTEGKGGDSGIRALAPRAGAGGRGGASPAPGAATSPPKPNAHEVRIAELSRSILDVGGAGMDLAKLSVAKRVDLRPLLLFLVEQGALTKDEMEKELADMDLDRVLDRIKECTARLTQERDKVRVLLYLEEAARAGEQR